jgi:hypothetical protein
MCASLTGSAFSKKGVNYPFISAYELAPKSRKGLGKDYSKSDGWINEQLQDRFVR